MTAKDYNIFIFNALQSRPRKLDILTTDLGLILTGHGEKP